MEEKKKHKVMIGIEVVLLCMLVAILGTNAASSNPPSNGVSYGKNNQTTVEGALNDLYNKANYGNASEGQILKDKTALVGGKKVTGTMPNNLSGTASSVITYENSLYYRIPAGYYGGLGWGSEISATYTDVASAIGLTAGKLLKGETVLGITGTGETSCPSCPDCPTCPTCLNTSDATATERDISSGKTAYVNGNKITGKGIQGKTYEFKKEEATTSRTFKNGEWIAMIPTGDGEYTDFSIELPFTPSRLISCQIKLTGNYSSNNQSGWDADFRMTQLSNAWWYMKEIANGFYVSGSNSVNSYTDTYTTCHIDSNKLIFRFNTICAGTGSCKSIVQSRAGKFYLSGVIAYE